MVKYLYLKNQKVKVNKDYITVYDNAIDSKVCDDLVKFFEDNKKHSFKEEKEWRSFQELDMSIFPDMQNDIIELLQPHIIKYKKDNNISDYVWPVDAVMENARFKKYLPNTNDRFELHADATMPSTLTRFLAMFIYLTDNDSGYTSFSTRDIRIQPKKGRLLMFPPNWCYPHAGEKVTDKPKYIIGTYCRYMLDN